MHVVVGATGTIGRETIRLLSEAGEEVVAVTRNPAATFPDDVSVLVGDVSRPGTLALPEKVTSVLLSPRAVGSAAAALLQSVANRGAQRVVLISAATVEYPVGERRFIEQFEVAEAVVRASSMPSTILRCADFAANALAWVPQVHAGDTVRGAYAAAATSPIHERDVAEVAVRGLVGGEHEGSSIHLLTGPESLDQRDKVRLIGEALARELSFAEVPPDVVRSGMLAQGLSAEVPDRLLGSLADYSALPGPTTDVVERVLGRPATPFAVWAADNAAAFTPAETS
ncbi:NAD(P)H-binding protein [Embleya scabrispora]|uniref:NAD(P)H-binding protein n=1 Tax=Embleya scabrispora TaxID=159449 RepID=UPI000475AB5C|nr:NAD(P)H-binding protein [Embleya scabrispora]MYS84629.1 NAD(P)H-binding protein [Streptomyces sp. SID5474]